jgi:hypothetical protein
VKPSQLPMLEQEIVSPTRDVFTETEIEGLGGPVQRYFRAAIAIGTPLATSARIRMRGQIKLNRWLRFRSRQVLNPHAGYVWNARVAGLINGSDYYFNGRGGMDWKIAGLKNLVHAEGPEVTRSALARGAAETVWIPTASLPRFGVEWKALTNRHIEGSWTVDGYPFTTRYTLDSDGMITSIVFDRWGDPHRTGSFGVHTFGGEVSGYDTFHGSTIPSSGNMGWFYGTERWDDGEFFRYQVTDVTPFGLEDSQ